MKQFSLDGRVAVITGGAGLLGREFCMALGEAGARPVVADLDEERARTVADEVQAARGCDALAVRVDVTDPVSVRHMVDVVVERFGSLDILVNNAAINPAPTPSGGSSAANAFEDYPLAEWNRSLAVDLTGMFLCAQAAGRVMVERGRGVIINVSSIYGLVSPDQRVYEKDGSKTRFVKPVTYPVTKSAVLGLTRYLATYWAANHIRVNALTPGGVEDGQDAEFVRRYSERTPMGRMANRSEYGGAVVFLASDASSYMTGANLVVDGGWTAW